MSFADYWEDEILDHLFGKGSYTPPTIYVGLSTADPGEGGATLAEPSGDGYERVETAASDWNSSSGGDITNANAIEFSEASGSWGTITHFCLFDADSEGHMLASGELTDSVAIGSGETPRFPASDLTVSLG